ncbi:MAG TPA: hypothetical protein VE594_04630 [Nitrososphaeraceae archaeon]|jgi:hypothetical protein|nr:hypothetical protein [Nitrososphaeraceae archaeon]
MRIRYWRLGITDVLEAKYPVEKANHWEIKCILGEYQHFGVFWFRYGAPYDKEPVHGICFYFNEIPKKIVQDLTEFIHLKFGGKVLYRQTRVFLHGSKEFADPKSIGTLANELSLKFSVPVEITIELEKVTDKEQQESSFNLPSSKALPIVGPD